jgi:proline-rich protein PRCC
MGPARQFAVPAPKEEVKISANFWSRQSGSVETSYQPSRMQKRKHQINSLAADCAAKRSELEQRRSQGFQTKAQTQAKYGW